MIRSAVTICLVAEARQGPFVYHDGLAAGCASAAAAGFDAVEIFAPAPDAVDPHQLGALLQQHNLQVAAVGTGAGMVKHGLSLTDADPQKRRAARDFIQQMIDFGARWQAPAIIGSMQGRWGGEIDRETALGFLRESLNELGTHARSRGVTLLYEPLNRYETNLLKTVADGAAFLKTLSTDRVRLLADLFHMNIEEANLAQAIRDGGQAIGHIHYVDSNRQAAGLGHLDFAPIAAALKEFHYDGYLSIEAFPIPDAQTTAAKSIESIRKHFG